jgi:hypothetical protein
MWLKFELAQLDDVGLLGSDFAERARTRGVRQCFRSGLCAFLTFI